MSIWTATPTETPTETPTVAPTEKIVFITSATFGGNLGGRAGADQKCQDAADNTTVPLSGTYRAWISDASGSPNGDVTFTKSTDPYVLVNGNPIADSYADLTATNIGVILDNAITVDENGNPSAATLAWTATAYTGDSRFIFANPALDSCNNWTSNTAGLTFAWTGAPTLTSFQWTEGGQAGCNLLIPIYCFQQ